METPEEKHAILQDPMKFFLAGQAYFTLRSTRTGTRYTYRVTRADDKQDKTKKANIWFVSLLIGPDNWSNYSYIGLIKPNSQADSLTDYIFITTGASKLPMEAAPVKAITYVIDCLRSQPFVPGVEIWHAGRCGRCGRMLTVPESIASGFGPECASLM